MADIVSLDGYRRKARAKVLRHATSRLRNFSLELHELAVMVAIEGCLRQWADDQPIGTIATFDDDRLTETRDPGVLALVQLRATIASTIAALAAEVR